MYRLVEDADHFIDRAQGRFVRSGVVDTDKPGVVGSKISDIRTSSGTFFARGETEVIAQVEERIAQWVMVDQSQGEGFQVLDYKVRRWRLHLDLQALHMAPAAHQDAISSLDCAQ